MSSRDALIEEIRKQPESLVHELHRYLAYLVERQKIKGSTRGGNSWPANYFDRTAGAFEGEPLERPVQPPFEKREDW